MPRLGHKKSRLGCRQCKARHVKCDELKPCSNCARHGVICSLVTWDPNSPQPPSAPTSNSSSNTTKRANSSPQASSKADTASASASPLPVNYVVNSSSTSREGKTPASEGSSPSSQSDHFPFLTRFIHRSDAEQGDIWVSDLELMHHWTIEAYDELSQRDDVRHLWRVEAPKHAVTHRFLMHEILAFSALHKASQLPDQRTQYYAFGIHHQDLAIRGVRKCLQNVTAHEASTIVATSTLLTLSVFASTGFELNIPEIPSAIGPIDGILNIFSLMQGMGNVLAMAQVHVLNSWLGPLFTDPKEAIPSQPMLQELVNQIPTLISFIDTNNDLPEQERKTYLQVIEHFEPVLQMSMPPCVDNRELRFLFFWPLHLSPEFLNNLRYRRSGALAIIMYYSIMLFAAQSRYWFMSGWGDQLMRACLREIDQEWLPSVRWPSSFVNQAPTWSLFLNMPSITGITLPGQSTSSIAYPQQRSLEVITHRSYAVPSPERKESSAEVQYARSDPSSTSQGDYHVNVQAYDSKAAPGNFASGN